MPLYQYECPKCKAQRQDIRCIAQRLDVPDCLHCKTPMELILSPVKGFVKNPAAKT